MCSTLLDIYALTKGEKKSHKDWFMLREKATFKIAGHVFLEVLYKRNDKTVEDVPEEGKEEDYEDLERDTQPKESFLNY